MTTKETHRKALDTADICKAVGVQVMDCLSGETGPPIAVMGHTLPDSTFEFLLGPIYLPRDEVSLVPPTETRQLLVNLRLEDQKRSEPRRVIWHAKAGDEYRETPAPSRAVVIERTDASPGEDVVHIYYHISA